jgi:hypothetical protein
MLDGGWQEGFGLPSKPAGESPEAWWLQNELSVVPFSVPTLKRFDP